MIHSRKEMKGFLPEIEAQILISGKYDGDKIELPMKD